MFLWPEAERTVRTALLSREQTQGPSSTRSAIANLYETHFERVARYISVRIGNFSEAQDLASEVFIRALRSADSYKDVGAPLEAWLFKIARNLSIDHLRQKARRPVQVPVEALFSLAADTDDPIDSLHHQEEVKRLHDAVQHLSEAQRQVIALRFGGEMSADEIALVMGKKPGAVREMQSAAIRKLRQLLGEET
ncbi:MAG: sigma-70 family RNA polymerase sigma factor [Chloroflexi bacterium]|nr:sigma-70 family RNA polymerase sigma factor [Chloroflexota bacterium]MBI4198281.1 sigma-70 family RNA polymerase sigma factor [Chloroflexota bacterium]